MKDARVTAIANAIRQKNGSNTLYRISDMAQAILDIPSGGFTPTGEIEITENGTFDVAQFASALVNVEGGGGGGSYVSKCDVGELTTEKTSATITIEHKLGVTPDFVVIVPKNPDGVLIDSGYTVGGIKLGTYFCGISSTKGTGAKGFSTSVNTIQNLTSTTFDFVARSTSYPFCAGEYAWMCGNINSKIQPPKPSGSGFNGMITVPIMETELEIQQIDAQLLSMLQAMSTMSIGELEEE